MELLLLALEEHQAEDLLSRGVQARGCEAISVLALDADNADVLMQERAVDLVCDSLELHEAHSDVAEQGCAALGALATADGALPKLEHSGATALLCNALIEHESAAAVGAAAAAAAARMLRAHGAAALALLDEAGVRPLR